MVPVRFPEANIRIAEHQDEYQTLHAYYNPGPEGIVTSCWSLSFLERIRLLFTGRIWWSQFTFGQALQPQLPMVDRPDFKRRGVE